MKDLRIEIIVFGRDDEWHVQARAMTGPCAETRRGVVYGYMRILTPSFPDYSFFRTKAEAVSAAKDKAREWKQNGTAAVATVYVQP